MKRILQISTCRSLGIWIVANEGSISQDNLIPDDVGSGNHVARSRLGAWWEDHEKWRGEAVSASLQGEVDPEL